MVDRKSKINYSLDLLWYYNNMLEYNNYLINNGKSYFSCVFFHHIFGLWKVLWLSSNAIKKKSSTKIIHRFYAIFTNLCFTLSVSIELFLKGVFAWVLSFSNEGKSSTFFQKKYMSIKRSYSQHLGRYRWYSFAFFSSCYSLNLEFLEQKSVIWQDRFLLVIVNILFITKGLFGCLFYWVVSSVESSESILIESKNKKDKFIQIQVEKNND